MFETDLRQWKMDGNGGVVEEKPGEYRVDIETPLTLWCPTPAEGPARIAFDCHLMTANSAMLVLGCARNWKGDDFDDAPRSGEYDDYNSGPLELYSVGFNRTAHVTDDIQPNASSANLRRIGGPEFEQYKDLTLDNADEQQMRHWHQWDRHSLMASICEPASGIDRFYRYAFEFNCPKIIGTWEGQTLFTLIDHRPDPLSGGRFGLRCMTPGGRFRIRSLSITAI